MENILRALAERLKQLNYTVTTAESCTGGGVAYYLTSIDGSSNWFNRAFVTYSNQAKVETLGVLESSIELQGVVSEDVVEQMAIGAALAARAQCAVAVSGIAGPGGGTPDKPVGQVCIAWSVDGVVDSETCRFSGDRASVRIQTIEYALNGLLQRL